MTLLPMQCRSTKPASLPAGDITSKSADTIRVTVKNTFLDVQSDSEESVSDLELHPNGAHTCTARLCGTFSALKCRDNEDVQHMDNNLPQPKSGMPSHGSLSSPCATYPIGDGFVSNVHASAVGRTSDYAQNETSATTGAQQLLLQIPLGKICGPELTSALPREHTVIVTNTVTEGDLQFVDFRLVLGRQGSLSAIPTSAVSLNEPPDQQSRNSQTAQSSECISWPMDAFASVRMAERLAATVPDDAGGTSHSNKVCRHWQNKGWCKYQSKCKFMHPEHQKGVGGSVLDSVKHAGA